MLRQRVQQRLERSRGAVGQEMLEVVEHQQRSGRARVSRPTIPFQRRTCDVARGARARTPPPRST